MAISAGSAIDNADFGKSWFKVATSQTTVASLNVNAETALAVPTTPSGYIKGGLYSFNSGHTNVVLRAISDTQLTFRNVGPDAVSNITIKAQYFYISTALG